MTSIEDALAKARAIAAKLSGVSADSPAGELGKRKSRWDEDPLTQLSASMGLGAMKKKKVYIPVQQHPEINFLGLLIGPRGRTQKEMQERTGAKILVRGRGSQKDGVPSSHPDDDDELHVAIEGSEDAVNRALTEVEEILFNPEQAMRLKQEQLKNLAEMNGATVPYTGGNAGNMRDHYGNPMMLDDDSVEIRVPNNLVGLIIGKGGEHIQRLQTQTGCHVQIAKESDMKPGDTMRSIILRGDRDAILEARRRIDDVINERTQSLRNNTPLGNKKELDNYSFVLRIPVPNDKVGVVIGRGGITIKTIQERTQAHVQVPTGPDEDNPTVRTLSVGADSREAAEAAQMEIFMVLQQHQIQANTPPPNSVFLQVPDDKVGIIIGKGGVTIKDIQARTQCKIQIPPHADPGSTPPIRTISIVGAPDQQFMAKFEIETLLGLMPGGGSMGMPMGMGGAYGQAMGGYGAPAMGMSGGWGAGQGYGMQASSMYGGAVATGYSQQSADHYYGYSQAGQSTTTDPSAAVSTDPTAYYADFWQYAQYYGEAAARAYYTTWSPPEGTPPPEGIVVPPPNPAPPADGLDGNGAAGTQATPSETSAAEQDPAAVAAAWEEYNKKYAEWQQQQAPQSQDQGQQQ